MKIHLENLRYSYNDLPVIDSVDIEGKDHGLFHLIGENGVGKSTIFKALNGEIYTSNSFVTLDNLSIDIYRTNLIVFIDDSFLGYSYLKANEYLEFIHSIYHSKMALLTIQQLSASIGFDQYSNYLIKNLSQGNRQKLALLSMIYSDARIILSDEGFEHFDLKSLSISKKMVTEIASKKIFFLISHTDIWNDISRTIIDVHDMRKRK